MLGKSLHRSDFLKMIPVAVAILVSLPYLRTTVFHDQAREPFNGDHWYNPYLDLGDTLLKANFHAHSHSWMGLTWGEDTAEEVVGAYAGSRYDIPALSNYHRITDSAIWQAPLIYIPTYEHGVNVRKVHCLCIGARSVSYIDFPVHLSNDHSSQVIRNLHEHCDLVALAHPGARSAHTPSTVTGLSGLDLMEVGNTMGVRTGYWDSVLSDGRAIWLLANDDTHDLGGKEIFRRWNMIYADTPSRTSAIRSLRAGNHYGVYSYDGLCEDNRLTRFEVGNDTLHIALRDSFNRLDLFGQGGALVHTRARDNNITYPIQKEDTYIRAEVHHDHCVMYLNPVVRHHDPSPPHVRQSMPAVDKSKTWFARGAAFFWIVFLLWLLWRLGRRQTPPGAQG